MTWKIQPGSFPRLCPSAFSHSYLWDVSHSCCGDCNPSDKICFCHTVHSAYSTACTCWRFPGEFFLVSRSVRDIALQVFFSANHFVIKPSSETSYWNSPHSSLWHFLQRVPKDSLRHLRKITWSGTLSKQKSVFHKWIILVDFIVDQLNISKLTLVLDFSYYDEQWHREALRMADGSWWPYEKRENRRRFQWENSLKLAEVMAKYSGWKNVFVHLAYQGENMYPGNRTRMESLLERIVVGHSYNAIENGKIPRLCACHDWYDDDSFRKMYAYRDSLVDYDPRRMALATCLGVNGSQMREGVFDNESLRDGY